MEPETARKLQAIFADVLQAEIDATADLDLRDLPAWDSVNHVHLIMDLEQEFGLEISDQDALGLTSLAGIRGLLARNACPVA